MDQEARTGRTAAIVGAVAYALAAALLVISTIMENRDNNNADNDMEWVAWVWTALVVLGTVAAAVTLYAVLKRSVGLKGVAVAAVAIAVVAAVASIFSWIWLVWGIVLSIAFALGVLEMRKHNLGLVGRPTGTDWLIPIAWPLGVIITFGLWATDIVEEAEEDLDWAYTSGFTLGALLTAISLAGIASWLGRAETAVPVATDPPGVAGY